MRIALIIFTTILLIVGLHFGLQWYITEFENGVSVIYDGRADSARRTWYILSLIICAGALALATPDLGLLK